MIMFAFGKRLLRWQVVALLWAAPFVCLPTALAEETQGPDTDAGKIGLEAEGTVPALWQSQEGKAIVVAAKMITRGAAEPDFHAACLEDAAECVAEITSSAPEGYTFEYRETDEDVAEAPPVGSGVLANSILSRSTNWMGSVSPVARSWAVYCKKVWPWAARSPS